MKAVRMHDYGDAGVLQVDEVPRPEASSGQVVIRVQAAGVNPVDWKTREGMLRKWGINLDLPYALGLEVAGTIASVGDGAERFTPGDAVYAFLPLRTGGGYAEYVAVNESFVAAKPKSIDAVHAAGVPLAATTAWQALVDAAKIHAGQTVLIHAGAGGVGHFAVQIAKARGARVITTASKRNHEFLRGLGADQVIDYHKQRFEDVVHNVDVVLDAVGGDTLERSYQVVKPGGVLLSITGQVDQKKLSQHSIKGQFVSASPNAEDLEEIAQLIDAGKIKPYVSKTFALEDVAKAHAQSETGHTRGKIVLEIR